MILVSTQEWPSLSQTINPKWNRGPIPTQLAMSITQKRRDKKKEEIFNIKTGVYLQSISLFVRYIVNGIQTVRDCISRHPLLHNFPSLCRYHCNLEETAKINLYPLVMVIVSSCPSPHITSRTHAFESSKEWCVVTVPYRRWSHLTILDAAALYTEWEAAESC